MIRRLHSSLPVLSAVCLAACGGGGSDETLPPVTSLAQPVQVVAGIPSNGAASATSSAGAAAESSPKMTVWYNPYEGVDFQGAARLLGQHHDHAGVTQARILAYDQAGYNVIGLQDYSGNRRFSYAWTSRRWPPDQWLPPSFMSRLKNIELFLPNAEEVGIPEFHVTSNFVDQYIESVSPEPGAVREKWQYKTGIEMLELIKGSGGVACLAHPFEPVTDTNYYAQFPCIEIYSAYANGLKEQGNAYFNAADRNRTMVENWDRVLKDNSRMLAVAVNDHFGPDTPPFVPVSPNTRDSGKVQVLVDTVSLEAYEDAFRRGAFFAIVDRGAVKGNFPYVREILVFPDSIFIDTDDAVRWITDFGVVDQDNLLQLDQLREKTTYARAEITNQSGVVYTQAFSIRPRGDVDGDKDVDADDLSACRPAGSGLPPGATVAPPCAGN